MRITRVYTRIGDRGTTRLVGGAEVRKDSERIEAYGTVDELNSVIGMVRCFNQRDGSPAEAVQRMDAMLARIQNDLFHVGSDLATPVDKRWEGIVLMGDDEVGVLEQWCDELNEDVGPLKEFILPGGGTVGSILHQARTVCRRAERRVVALDEPGHAGSLRYLNRLSDFLFLAARWVAKTSGIPEVMWQR